jgi:hypothetical protein
MECVPTESEETASAAEPPLTVTVPSRVVPSLNWMLPLAEDGDTCAEKVTACPETAGFNEEVIVAVVAALLTVTFTTAEVLAVFVASPE